MVAFRAKIILKGFLAHGKQGATRLSLAGEGLSHWAAPKWHLILHSLPLNRHSTPPSTNCVLSCLSLSLLPYLLWFLSRNLHLLPSALLFLTGWAQVAKMTTDLAPPPSQNFLHVVAIWQCFKNCNEKKNNNPSTEASLLSLYLSISLSTLRNSAQSECR